MLIRVGSVGAWRISAPLSFEPDDSAVTIKIHRQRRHPGSIVVQCEERTCDMSDYIILHSDWSESGCWVTVLQLQLHHTELIKRHRSLHRRAVGSPRANHFIASDLEAEVDRNIDHAMKSEFYKDIIMSKV